MGVDRVYCDTIALQLTLEHHHFPSRGITEVCEDMARTNGKLARLTDRERETACLIADGNSTKQIAVKLASASKPSRHIGRTY